MRIHETDLPGVLIIEPRVFGDQRGFFMETWNQAGYAAAGLPENFVQDNLSCSRKGVLRGLHFQKPNSQGKLVYVLEGEVFDVAVDIRLGSPTFGQWASAVLSAENKRQFFIPPGFAHGFCVTSDRALFAYKCNDRYNPQAEGSVLWNDPDLSIPWPVGNPELSGKDAQGVRLADIDISRLPNYER
ncbi:MAG: dTDP-4-dehydrorhamnose 3,5-epimerase [Gallionellales bacterium RIFCSPLOWO2_12_FULL_59_22]|nr:MAG: dTDP-4-dehydrorhamnose 3,5-epimerase [Gallionellales bacterium RIFCSPLOWO2_02_FULL_59_110]OGT05195.1 MAG: dTDP-4-dehydrorhamnose 3,5-epimerase [Gallionellales bacterium RIFCSPLOWO2_02_58_13]OGT13463.1 MAG: dTDP-4-dehydrorhamnose 3,5-epimerase [Gallionellales bacterium RIFCSPLOWO2_12_FULL_59_22]